MLKKYLQALLEAFIGSKKEWVGRQSLPFDIYSTQSDSGISNYQEHTVPIDGYVNVQVDSDVQSGLARCRLSYKNVLHTTSLKSKESGVSNTWLPCGKGEKIRIWVSSNCKYTITFIKSNAS